ncbi:MAG: LytTR family transcriptional regulator DNA-binding domain-containing protein [Bacteroidota bacterium]
MFLKKVRSYLNRPFPLMTARREKWWTSLRIGSFVFLFLYVFKPFQLNNYSNVLWICLGYGWIALVSTAIFLFVVPLVLPSYFQEESWIVKKELLYKISPVVLIGFANTIYSMQIHLLASFWESFLYFEICTLAVGIFPLTYFIYLIERRNSKHYQSLSAHLIFPSQVNAEQYTNWQPIELKSYNQVVKLALNASQLYYVKSSSNYVEVIYWHNDHIQKQLIRNTISAIESQLSSTDTFYRCHKSYVVNLAKIKKVSGNARGLKLHFFDLAESIPVSRKNNEYLKGLLTSRL